MYGTEKAGMETKYHANKRMKSDFFARYARKKVADAKHYVLILCSRLLRMKK